MATPSIANTLLCLFSKDKCILLDDCGRKVQEVVPIVQIWPQLSSYNMGSDLDAAYFCPEFTQVAFFKGDKCAIHNYQTGKWNYGAISDFYTVAAGQEKFYKDLTAASTGVREQNIAFYKDHEFIFGPIGDPTAGKVPLTNGPGTLETNGWTHLLPDQQVVASTLMCRTTGSDAGDPTSPLRSIIFKDTDGSYKFTLDNTNNPSPAIPGSFSLKELWPEYDDNQYPITAATRVDTSLLQHVIHDHGGPGPVWGGQPNSLCDELPNVMKSICSLTVLMHKVVDACYPPSAWPTQPYPDGCSTSNHKHKHKDCGCGGQGKH
ncbi:hypothetical protein [Bordetella genomosp. 9]|uniref:Uncharacterized protein n=1 Tax=Bordetella genomosp. 9 TaxID=1416803 RepID=A0A1W6YV94_9BORD|nr:hypothetical protein [Bordetella genomosp. 9]ARP85020.1 hypothetical protein CAL13_01365 [Bordetella genomosp. 9]